MPDDQLPTGDAATTVQTPPAVPESVQRLESQPESNKPLMALDDVLSQHFQDQIKSEPEPSKEDKQPDPTKTAEKAKDAPKGPTTPQKPIAPSAPVKPVIEPKIVDPESIKMAKDLKGEALAGWNTLKKNSILINEERKRLLEKNKALEATVANKGGATQKEIDALKTQLEELKPFRQMVDIQHDPDFVKEYDTPLKEKKDELAAILREEKVSDQIINSIDFTDKNKVNIVLKTLRDAGKDTQADELYELAREIQAITKKRSKSLEESRTKFKEYSKTREQTEANKRTEEEAVQNQIVEASISAVDEEGKPEFPFLIMQQVPEGATKEQAAQIQKQNQGAEYLQERIRERLASNDPKSRAINAVAAVIGAVKDAQLKGALARIAELEGELGRVSAAGGERKSAVTKTPSPRGEAQTSDDALAESFPAAMARHR